MKRLIIVLDLDDDEARRRFNFLELQRVKGLKQPRVTFPWYVRFKASSVRHVEMREIEEGEE